MHIYLDFETRSAVTELKKTGPWPYAEHPSTSVWCLAVKVGRDRTRIWLPSGGGTMNNNELGLLIEQASEIHAHNVQFEQAIWHHIMFKRYGFPDLPVHKLRDTAAVAATHALPRPLGQACDVMRLPVQKDAEGQKLMLKMCKPRAPRKAEWKEMDAKFGHLAAYQGLKAAYHNTDKEKQAAMCLYAVRNWAPEMAEMLLWHEDPADIERLCQYCIQDVEAEHALGQALGDLPALELPVFQHDLVVQRRGICVDTGMAQAALSMIDEYKRRLLAELDTLTSGLVRTPRQVEAGRKWLASRGLNLDNMQKETVEAALKGGLEPEVLRFLQIRRALGASATDKYDAALHQTCSDGRLRGFSMYHGAGTGRWAGKGMQLHNLFRGIFDLGKESSAAAFWHAVELVKRGDLDSLMIEFGDPMPVLASTIRPLLLAAPGHVLHAADFSAIEGRGLAWLADEEWVLDAYRAYDRKEGPDMYIITASKILGKPSDQITKAERKNPGKPGDLGCFGPDTRVLTSNGIKRIADVSLADRLWDGVEWVTHDGLIEQGEKEVIDLCGVEVTPDHLIHIGWGWRRAQTVVSCELMLHRALEKGSENLPCLAWRRFAARARATLSAWFGSSAPAEPSPTWSMRPTCGVESLRDATLAPRSRVATGGSGITHMPTSAPTRSIDAACLTECPPASGGATTRTSRPMPTTVDEESMSTNPGEKTAGASCGICSRLKAGMTRTSSWIGSMWTRATSQETCASSPRPRTRETSGLSETSNNASSNSRPVFDILNSGPRNCFTILSDEGPLLVHNCGYQGGYMALTKFGATVPEESTPFWTLQAMRGLASKEAREILDSYIDMATGYGGSPAQLLDQLGAAGWPMPSSDEIFEAWGRDVVKKWRASRPLTTAMWKGVEKAAIMCVETGQPQSYGKVTYRMEGCFCTCELPSGRRIYYPFPQVLNREMIYEDHSYTKLQFSHMTVDAETKQWVRRFAHGGLLTENITQAVCRDILAAGLLRLEASGFPVVLHVHDEAVAEVRRNTRTLEEFEQILTVVPSWAAGFPISAAGWTGERYRKD